MLIEEIGKGGMGIVYRARQESLQRDVALKVLPKFSSLDEAAIRRFHREAEAAATLRHPGIVPVHAFGVEEDTHYFAMELLPGPTLADMLEPMELRRPERLIDSMPVESEMDNRVPVIAGSYHADPTTGITRYVESCVAIGLHLCEALSYAHTHGLVHRDLKPSNILFDSAGRPVLVDFGLVRHVGESVTERLTLTHDQLGTPSYMAPEQVRSTRDLDQRVDVYGLGAILYQMLTLRPPFEGLTVSEILQKVDKIDPIPVRELNPRVPQDLEAVVHRCLAKDREARYPSMESLDLDLRAVLAGEAVSAKRLGLWRKIDAVLRRNSGIGKAVAATVVVALGLMGVSGWMLAERAEKHGRELLVEAKSALVERLDLSSAQHAFGRAEGLLDAAAVRSARVEALREAFRKHYPARLEDLSIAFASLDPAARIALRDEVERVAGRGTLRVEGEGEVSVRSSAPEAGDDAWVQIGAEEHLPMGDHLVRLEDRGETTLFGVTLGRDEVVTIDSERLRSLPRSAGKSLSVDVETGTGSLVARQELSVALYGAWFESLPRALRDEMQPSIPLLQQELDDPVRGLSFHQARVAAAGLGGHLMTLDEFRGAASGGLRERPYPWDGETWAPDRVVANPLEYTGPEAVDSLPESASPGGLQHMLGNVAEILSLLRIGDGEERVAAGGHFHTEQADSLRLDQPETLVERAAAGDADGSEYHGMRLARFVAPSTTRDADSRVETLRADFARGRIPSRIHDWSIRSDGRVEYLLEMVDYVPPAALTGPDAAVRFALSTPGFLHLQEHVVRSADGTMLARLAPSGREATELSLPANVCDAHDGRLHLRIEAVLSPTAGLVQHGDGYELSLPIENSAGRRSVYRVRFPGPVGLDSIDPEPWHTQRTALETELVWTPTTTQATSQAGAAASLRTHSAKVRFRIDGMLTSEWPVRAPIVAWAKTFLDKLHGGHAQRIGLLAETFQQQPGNLGRNEVTVRKGQKFDNVVIRDVTAVGDVILVDFVADWETTGRSRSALRLDDVPMYLHLIPTGPGAATPFQAIRLGPQIGTDDGDFDGARYINKHLGVSITPPPSLAIQRLQATWCSVQVRIVHPEHPDVYVDVFGMDSRNGDSDHQSLMILSGYEIELRPGEVLSDRGSGEDRRLEWSFKTASGRASRESWHAFARGRRRFLTRCATIADDELTAGKRHGEYTDWFLRVLSLVEIR